MAGLYSAGSSNSEIMDSCRRTPTDTVPRTGMMNDAAATGHMAPDR